MSDYLSNLLFGALIFTAPVAAIYLFSVVERRYWDRLCAWFDGLRNWAWWYRLRVEEFIREKLS